MWPFSSRKARPRTSDRPRRATYRPRLEALEDRRLLSAGALDPTFGSGGIVTTPLNNYNDTAYGEVLQPNGDIIVYGDAQTSGGGTYLDQFGLARYTPAGTLDTTFGSGGIVVTKFPNYKIGTAKYYGSDYIVSAALQADGKIVAAGHNRDLVRYNSNGSLDTTFGSGGIVTYPSGVAWGAALLIQPSNGDIVVAGEASNTSPSSIVLLRYTPSGALDPTFGTGGEVVTTVTGLRIYDRSLALENGDIVAGGWAGTGGYPDYYSWFLARYTPGGSLDTTFGSGGIVNTQLGTDLGGTLVQSLLVQPDGKIVAVGMASTSTVNGNTAWALGRYNVDGSLDSSFGTGGIVTSSITGNDKVVSGSALQSNGQIVVTGGSNGATNLTGGGNSSPTGVLEVGVYNPDGSPDTSFGSGGFVTQAVGSGAMGRGAVIQSDGKIVVAGTAAVSGRDDFLLVRFGPSAAQVGSFTASPNPAPSGSSVTLTASNITLADPGSSITQVAFYVDSNGDGVLEPGTDTLLGYATQASPGVWTLTFSTANWAAAIDTLFAQAKDSDGVLGDPLALFLQVT
jgi:uncharacterized delta-60 repeat protein